MLDICFTVLPTRIPLQSSHNLQEQLIFGKERSWKDRMTENTPASLTSSRVSNNFSTTLPFNFLVKPLIDGSFSNAAFFFP